jgi:osmotically-inducible protein OsmY
MTKDSEQIKKDVIEKLYWDSRVDASNIRIDINDGEIILMGTVPNYTAKQAAWHDALLINGVEGVHDRISVKYPASALAPADDELKNNVKTMLSLSSSIDSVEIEVTVENGKVILCGSVDSYWKKVKAEDLVFDIIGVTDVINKLTVIPTGDFFDRDIAKDIIKNYDRIANIESEDINVKVENGVVTLTGNVSDWTTKDTVINFAHLTPGVKDVIDYINVA